MRSVDKARTRETDIVEAFIEGGWEDANESGSLFDEFLI